MAEVPIARGLSSRAVLIDTGVFRALAHSGDSHHLATVGCLKSIAKHRLSTFVSIPTIYESHRRILFDIGRPSAERFLNHVFDGTVNLVRTTIEDEQEARRFIGRYAAFRLTLTDAVNMAVMTRLGIAAVFSFDNHFLQAGFIRIPPFHL